MQILTQRYGNPQVLISAYRETLFKLGKIKNKDNLVGLKKFYNEVENCVRSLRSLRVETGDYGSLLLHILREKLPADLLVQIARRFGGNVWTLEAFLQFFHEELSTSESCAIDLDKRSTGHGNFTASNLYGQVTGKELDEHSDYSKHKGCVFCNKSDHYHSQCRLINNPKSRKDILRKESRCFICLNKSHLAKECHLKYKCRKCSGRHHISICSRDAASNEKRNEPV